MCEGIGKEMLPICMYILIGNNYYIIEVLEHALSSGSHDHLI